MVRASNFYDYVKFHINSFKTGQDKQRLHKQTVKSHQVLIVLVGKQFNYLD